MEYSNLRLRKPEIIKCLRVSAGAGLRSGLGFRSDTTNGGGALTEAAICL